MNSARGNLSLLKQGEPEKSPQLISFANSSSVALIKYSDPCYQVISLTLQNNITQHYNLGKCSIWISPPAFERRTTELKNCNPKQEAVNVHSLSLSDSNPVDMSSHSTCIQTTISLFLAHTPFLQLYTTSCPRPDSSVN